MERDPGNMEISSDDEHDGHGPADADELVVKWCWSKDWYFDGHWFSRTPKKPHQGQTEKTYVKLDPLEGPNGEKYLGTYALKQAWGSLKRQGHVFLATVLAVLCDESEFSRQCVPKPAPAPVGPGRKESMNRRNLDELGPKSRDNPHGVGFLSLLAPPKPHGRTRTTSHNIVIRYASLFTRPKANDTNRLLLNGKPGNAVLNPPPYFTFFSPEVIISLLRSLGTFFGFTVDVRHCFYRIPMHGKMAVFYAISRGSDGTWLPTVLPMGSTWGPALGQTTTVAMIVYREGPTDPDLGQRVPPGCVPAILHIVDKDEVVIGYILICIDNVAVVCRDPAVTNAWFTRLNRNAKALGIFPLKRKTAPTGQTPTSSSSGYNTFTDGGGTVPTGSSSGKKDTEPLMAMGRYGTSTRNCYRAS